MPQNVKKRSWLKITGLVLGGLVALAMLLVAAGVLLAPDDTRKKTPAGFPVNQVLYLPLDKLGEKARAAGGAGTGTGGLRSGTADSEDDSHTAGGRRGRRRSVRRRAGTGPG